MPLQNATVTLENLTAGTSSTVTTGTDGLYSFTNLPTATYRVTPTRIITPNEYEYDFIPPSATFENLSADQVQNFYGEPAFSISGHITHQNGVRMSGVSVTLRVQNSTGPPMVSVTNANGEYRFDDLFSNRYELRPVLEGYEFFPPAVFFEGLSSHRGLEFCRRRTAAAAAAFAAEYADAGVVFVLQSSEQSRRLQRDDGTRRAGQYLSRRNFIYCRKQR